MGTGWIFRTIHDPVDGIWGLHPADLDGDGDSDLIFSLPTGVEWLENDNGDASSWTAHTLFPGDLATSSNPADIDGDGDLDVVSTLHERWFENNGSTTIWDSHNIADYFDLVRAIKTADLDLDGDVDVLMGVLNDGVDWHESDGTGLTWTPHRDNPAAELHAFDLSVADVDRDGDPDFFISQPQENTLAFAENLGGQVSVETTAIAPTVLPQGGADALFSIEITHLGRAIDSAAELATLELLFEERLGVPLATHQANALIEMLEVHRDDGDGDFNPGADELVTSVQYLALVDGRLTVQLPDGATGCEIQNGSPGLFFVSVQATPDASTQIPSSMVVTHLVNGENDTPASIVEDRNHDMGLLFQQTTDITTAPVYFTGPDTIFIDGFESGDTSMWN